MNGNAIDTSLIDIVPTGKAVFYLHSRPVLTWLYLHGQLVVDSRQEYIISGKKLDEERWAHKRSLDLTPYGKADWVTGAQTNPVIHEGSRASKHRDPKRAQLRHYLWAAKKLYGINATGELHIKKGREEEIEPDHEAVERDHEKLKRMMYEPMPEPKRIRVRQKITVTFVCRFIPSVGVALPST